MKEDTYRVLGRTGVIGITAGVIMTVVGVAGGVLSIVAGGYALKTRKNILL